MELSRLKIFCGLLTGILSTVSNAKTPYTSNQLVPLFRDGDALEVTQIPNLSVVRLASNGGAFAFSKDKDGNVLMGINFDSTASESDLAAYFLGCASYFPQAVPDPKKDVLRGWSNFLGFRAVKPTNNEIKGTNQWVFSWKTAIDPESGGVLTIVRVQGNDPGYMYAGLWFDGTRTSYGYLEGLPAETTPTPNLKGDCKAFTSPWTRVKVSERR